MAAVLYRFRVELRGHWRAWLALALLAGIAAGVVMVAFAGARRTASSLHRVVVAQRAADVLINPNAGDISKSQLQHIESRPEVASAAATITAIAAAATTTAAVTTTPATTAAAAIFARFGFVDV